MCDCCTEDSYAQCSTCGVLVCFDVSRGDDVLQPAAVSESGDLVCVTCLQDEQDAAAADADNPGWAFDDDDLLP